MDPILFGNMSQSVEYALGIRNRRPDSGTPYMAFKDDNNFDEKKEPEPEFLNFEGAQESIPRNQFRQAM